MKRTLRWLPVVLALAGMVATATPVHAAALGENKTLVVTAPSEEGVGIQAFWPTTCQISTASKQLPTLRYVNGVLSWVVYANLGDLWLYSSFGHFCSVGKTKFVNENGFLRVRDENNAVRWSKGDGVGHHTIYQGDGNLVVYRSNNTAIWGAPIPLSNGHRLAIQADGNVVIYNSSWTAIWATGTAH